MRHLISTRCNYLKRRAARLLVLVCIVLAALPNTASAKKSRALAPSSQKNSAAQTDKGAAATNPAASPPQLATPVSNGTLGEDNAKELDPAMQTQWTIRDRRPHSRPQNLALSLGVWPPSSVSASLWYAIPILPDGLIPSVNDSFDIEFGAVIAGYFDGLDHGAFIPAVGVRWMFHVTRNFIPFATLKLNMQFGFGPYNPDLFGVDMSLGTLLRVADWAYLRFELGYPQGIAVGISFPIGS